MPNFALLITKIQMLSPASELFINRLDLDDLEKILFDSNDDTIDAFWSAFSQIGGDFICLE